jgi:hypothetical protein
MVGEKKYDGKSTSKKKVRQREKAERRIERENVN